MDEPVFMLTTNDNPYSPFDEFDNWYLWDISHGYGTSALLARVTRNSPDLSPAQAQRSVNDAIDEIVRFNLTGNYVKVSKEDYENWKPSNETTYGAKAIT